VDAVLKENKN